MLAFITGNPGKAELMRKWLKVPVEQVSLDLPEIQSLDLKEVLEAKARSAYDHAKMPVIVDDVSFVINSLNDLPGPLIKWFLKSLGTEGICRLTDHAGDRSASVHIGIGYFDGAEFHSFIETSEGSVAPSPRGPNGFGWDPIFIPNGLMQTRGELSEVEYERTSVRLVALERLKKYLEDSGKL